MLHANVVDGVHRIEDAYTNPYLVEEDGRLTVVDTGVPLRSPGLRRARTVAAARARLRPRR
jgi:hypothetical protein